ncbi:MAG: hypothetical protein SVV03_04125 [Candidatus Nanohaloarchaea archaeon]|nr:hypothetical protein [Candidatus Nanohaloarchaea archaeon]
METPLCSVCQDSDDILCTGCQQKIEDGELTETAVEVSRFLMDEAERVNTLRDIEIKSVKEASGAIVIITGKGDGPKVVGRNGEVVKKLANEFNSSIRVVEDSGVDDEVIENLLEPVEVQGINTVYKPEGTQKKVVVNKGDKSRVPITREEFKEIVKELTGEEYTLSYE